jgi:hypothetical protein
MAQSAQLFFDSLDSAAAVSGLAGRAEDLYFEAKTCSTPFSERDQQHLAEALSGFANADGGVLIYGLVARGGDASTSTPDIVTGVQPIENLTGLLAQALGLVGQIVEPPIDGVRVEIRAFDRNPASGFLLVYVPASELLHRSRKDREFYRRHGTGFYRMEYFEIAEFFGRRRRPELKISARAKGIGNVQRTSCDAGYVIALENVGRGIAKFPGLLLKESRADLYGLDGNGRVGLPLIPTSNGRNLLYGGSSNHVIYPQATLEVTIIVTSVPWPGSGVAHPPREVEYELYAEDMGTVRGSLELPEPSSQ